jgi:hypothetical protein
MFIWDSHITLLTSLMNSTVIVCVNIICRIYCSTTNILIIRSSSFEILPGIRRKTSLTFLAFTLFQSTSNEFLLWGLTFILEFALILSKCWLIGLNWLILLLLLILLVNINLRLLISILWSVIWRFTPWLMSYKGSISTISRFILFYWT